MSACMVNAPIKVKTGKKSEIIYSPSRFKLRSKKLHKDGHVKQLILLTDSSRGNPLVGLV
jgi:hypothetical protein